MTINLGWLRKILISNTSLYQTSSYNVNISGDKTFLKQADHFRASASMWDCMIPAFFSFAPLILTTMGGD